MGCADYNGGKHQADSFTILAKICLKLLTFYIFDRNSFMFEKKTKKTLQLGYIECPHYNGGGW
jgi:hypothetical protein